jgi:hypothetical protein
MGLNQPHLYGDKVQCICEEVINKMAELPLQFKKEIRLFVIYDLLSHAGGTR